MQVSAKIHVSTHENRSTLVLTFESLGATLMPLTHFCFSIATPLVEDAVDGGCVVERQGDWHKMLLKEPFNGLQDCVLTLPLIGPIKKSTDYPAGLYLESETTRVEVLLSAPIRRAQISHCELELTEPVFIPSCPCHVGEGMLSFPSALRFDSSPWRQSWLHRLLARLNQAVPVVNDAPGWMFAGQEYPELEDAFQLTIDAEGALLRYRNGAGFLQGQAFLFQYVLQWGLVGRLPPCALKGSATYDYRGVHLDVVRHFFAANQIMQWLDIFALYQYSYFHWHLTDDDGWRVQSKAFPQLTDIGAWRGPGLPLPPQMGSGKDIYGGFYTTQVIAEVVAHAEGVGMSIVPEMDLPGHARALLKSLPSLVEVDDESQYRSVQFHNDNVLNPAYGDTMAVIETLVDEWCELFPSALFHVGSDEIPKGVWQGSPSANNWVKENDRTIGELQGYFLSRIEHRLQANGKTMAGWEEVVDGGGTSNSTWVYSWQGIDAGLRAAKAGHPVVMTPAQYCYLDLAIDDQFETPGYWWAGTVSLSKAYQYKPKQGFSDDEARLIRGVQYCLWTELVELPEQAEQMWFPRLLAGAEVVFESNTNDGYLGFLARLKAHSVLLNRLGIAVDTDF